MGSYLDDPSLNDTPRDQINMERNLVRVCQSEWEFIRPTEYFPETFITGTCIICGDETFVAMVRKDELPQMVREINFGPVANPDGSPTEFTKQMLADTGRDPEEFAASVSQKSYADPQKNRWFKIHFTDSRGLVSEIINKVNGANSGILQIAPIAEMLRCSQSPIAFIIALPENDGAIEDFPELEDAFGIYVEEVTGKPWVI